MAGIRVWRTEIISQGEGYCYVRTFPSLHDPGGAVNRGAEGRTRGSKDGGGAGKGRIEGGGKEEGGERRRREKGTKTEPDSHGLNC